MIYAAIVFSFLAGVWVGVRWSRWMMEQYEREND